MNGKPLTGKPDLVRLEFNERDSICSGFFLTPDCIVTAGHCLFSWRDDSKAKLTGILSADDKKIDIQVLEAIPHPEYEKGWVTHDVGLIRVKRNTSFQGNFSLSGNTFPRSGTVVYFGAGKIDMDMKIYGRTTGEAPYLKLGPYILGWGPSAHFGEHASIASNDSGSPVVEKGSAKVIGIASQSTAITTSGSFLPAISLSASLDSESNRAFVDRCQTQK